MTVESLLRTLIALVIVLILVAFVQTVIVAVNCFLFCRRNNNHQTASHTDEERRVHQNARHSPRAKRKGPPLTKQQCRVQSSSDDKRRKPPSAQNLTSFPTANPALQPFPRFPGDRPEASHGSVSVSARPQKPASSTGPQECPKTVRSDVSEASKQQHDSKCPGTNSFGASDVSFPLWSSRSSERNVTMSPVSDKVVASGTSQKADGKTHNQPNTGVAVVRPMPTGSNNPGTRSEIDRIFNTDDAKTAANRTSSIRSESNSSVQAASGTTFGVRSVDTMSNTDVTQSSTKSDSMIGSKPSTPIATASPIPQATITANRIDDVRTAISSTPKDNTPLKGPKDV
ncbi:hypothetical protein AAVH_01357 [Aphelenchoides avenae]|nr:hypothetical protein AAVH_01357 [Aphelenchus avenae]